VGTNFVALAGGVHACRAVEAVAVEKGDGGDFEFHRTLNEVFRLRGAFEEAEGAGCVELDVAGFSHRVQS
jgi:hypothetical protein